MKQLFYLCALLITLLSCRDKDPAPAQYLKPLALGLEPQSNGVSLKWTPVFFFEEGMYGGPTPTDPAQYEIYSSDSDEKSLQKIAVVAGNIREYVLRNQPEGKTIYVRVKAIHPRLTSSESNVATTNIGQPGTTSLLFPDGTPEITFGSWGGSALLYTGWNELWTVRLPDGNLRTGKNKGSRSVLSPDGRSIAFLGTRNSNTSYSTQLFVETIESGNVRLFDTQQAIFTVEWSNDGRWLAYTTSDAVWKVSVADGTRLLVSRRPANFSQSQIAWSPDDQAIITVQERTVPSANRYVTNLVRIPAGGGESQPLLLSDWRDDQPAFSPDGSQLAFISNRSGYPAVWVMNRQTGKLRQLTGSSEAFYYINRLDWMDDTHLTYTAQLSPPVNLTLKKLTLP